MGLQTADQICARFSFGGLFIFFKVSFDLFLPPALAFDVKQSTEMEGNQKLQESTDQQINRQTPFNDLVLDKYRISSFIGKGSFGELWIANNITPASKHSKDKQVAVKVELQRRKSDRSGTLLIEASIYKRLNDGKEEGLARFYGCTVVASHRVLVMELLGPTLEDKFNQQKRHFKEKTVLQIAIQLVQRIKTVHNHGVLFKDVKPENFLLGLPGSPKENVIHIVDFGLAETYMSDLTGRHIPFLEGKGTIGTARYMSLNSHQGNEQSRRDDLESIGYMLVYFMKGQLPWQGMRKKLPADQANSASSLLSLIYKKKRQTRVDELCGQIGDIFAFFIRLSKNLRFDEAPNYERLERNLQRYAFNNDIQLDDRYEWDREESAIDTSIGIGSTPASSEVNSSLPQNQLSNRKIQGSKLADQ